MMRLPSVQIARDARPRPSLLPSGGPSGQAAGAESRSDEVAENPVGVHRLVQAGGGRAGDQESDGLADDGGQPVLRRLAYQGAAIGVGDDQAGVRRQDLRRKIRGDGEEQPVAVGAVLRPLRVDLEIDDGRLDLDDPDVAPGAMAARSARRPPGSTSSGTTTKPCW